MDTNQQQVVDEPSGEQEEGLGREGERGAGVEGAAAVPGPQPHQEINQPQDEGDDVGFHGQEPEEVVVDFEAAAQRDGYLRHDPEQEELDAADRLLKEHQAQEAVRGPGRSQAYVAQKRRQLEAQQPSSKLQQSSRKQMQLQHQSAGSHPLAAPVSRSLLSQSARQQQMPMSSSPAQNAEAAYLAPDKMSRFQVAFISATLGEADALPAYVNSYLCNRRHYARDWRSQCKASSFLTQWMHLTIPNVIRALTPGQLAADPVPCVPGGSLSKILLCLFAILDQGQEIYNSRYCNHPLELLHKLVDHNIENFGERERTYVKPEFLQRSFYHVSVFFVNSLEAFCQSGGFQLLLLALKGKQHTEGPARGFIPSFFLYTQVLELVCNLKEYLDFDFYQKQVEELRDVCMDYVKNRVDEDSLRHVTSRDQGAFIQRMERLLNSVVYERKRRGDECQQETEVYQHTEKMELELALKCLRMPILEKKFIGHAILALKIRQVKARPAQSEQDRGLQGGDAAGGLTGGAGRLQGQGQNHLSTLHQLRSRWPDRDKLIGWMDENKIFDMMFGESLHPEVIKKSKDLLEFLYQNGRIGEEQLNMMWDCAMQKHEVYKVAILKALIFLASIVRSQELRIIYEKVRALPPSQMDKFMMLLLKTMAKNVAQTVEGDQQGGAKGGQGRTSRRFELLMGAPGAGSTRKRAGPQRRSSDVGAHSRALAAVAQVGRSPPGARGLDLAVDNSKISPWDDHDAAQIRRDVHVDHDYFKRPRRQARGRSSSQVKAALEPTGRSRSLGGGAGADVKVKLPGPQPKQERIEVAGPETRAAEETGERAADVKESTSEAEGDITNVPQNREDKNTADEDDSPRQIGMEPTSSQLFDDEELVGDKIAKGSGNAENPRGGQEKPSSAVFRQEEEEKMAPSEVEHEGPREQAEERDPSKVSLRHLLFEIQIQPAAQAQDGGLDPEEANQMRRLAIDLLKLMWQYCMEDMVAPRLHALGQADVQQPELLAVSQQENQIQDYLQVHNAGGLNRGLLSAQVHQVAIENLCQVLNYHFPMSSFFFMNLCVQNLKRNRSAISSQVILQRLIEGTAFPIVMPERTAANPPAHSPSQIDSRAPDGTERQAQRALQTGNLPRNHAELILALDQDLQITNECLSSYVEFKRSSVQLIFDQFGDMDNDVLGAMGGDHDENLETQSSLDNNTNQTGEDRSRFSQSIVSSTQKSDTADYLTSMTRSQQKSSQKQRSRQPYGPSAPQHGERGQSMPKHGILKQQRAQASNQRQASHLFDVEANSSTFKPVLETPDGGQSALLAQNRHLDVDEPGGREASADHTAEADAEVGDTEHSAPGGTSLGINSPGMGQSDAPGKMQRFVSTRDEGRPLLQDSSGGPHGDKEDPQMAVQGRRTPKSEAGEQKEELFAQLKKDGVHEGKTDQATQRSLSGLREEEAPSERKLTKMKAAASVDRDTDPDNLDSSSDKVSRERTSQSQGPSQVQTQNQNRQFLNNLITNRALQLNFIQEMTKRLEFLKFLTKGALCKTLKNAQINVLWECLVVNAFNEDERDQFFVFCTEILNSVQANQFKMEQRARNNSGSRGQAALGDHLAEELLFDEDCLEMIFFEILLRLDYKSCEGGSGFTPKMYQCFERYFIYINEQYGQIVTSSHALSNLLNTQTCDITSPALQFEVFDHQLIGIEALWEIILGAQDERIYKRASEFLMRLHKRLAKEQSDDAPGIKELFFQNCMTQIRLGLQDIEEKNQQMLRAAHFDSGGASSGVGGIAQYGSQGGSSLGILQQNYAGGLIQQLHPDLANSASIDASRHRISRSIKLLSQFIQEFEGLRSREGGPAGSRGRGAAAASEVTIVVDNQIRSTRGARKINLTLPSSTKVGELKEQISSRLTPPRTGPELCLLFRGKDLIEDLKTLKDVGMKSIQADGSVTPARIIMTLQERFDLADGLLGTGGATEPQYTPAQLNEGIEQLKAFMSELSCSEEVMKLALKKCKLDLTEAIMMLTTEQAADLEEEVRAEQEANDDLQLMTNTRTGAVDPAAQRQQQDANEQAEPEARQEQRLSEMISNRSECFDLLFGLLNLGVADITTASWSLLTQVPVNQQLLSKIRLLDEVAPVDDIGSPRAVKVGAQAISGQPQRHMSQMEWSQIIDPNGIHKMLYSLQLVNQLITINNEKLSEAEIQERFDWRQRFLELGGFDHLYFILITYNFDSIDDDAAAGGRQIVQRQEEAKQTHEQEIPSQSRKQKAAAAKAANQSGQNKRSEKSQSNLYKRTQAQCLGHLISIIKIFLQAAILSDDEKNLLTLIASSSTSPFKKQGGLPGQSHGNQSYGPENCSSNQSASGGETHSDKDTSSVNTPKFANSFTSTTPPALGQNPQGDQDRRSDQGGTTEPADNHSQTSFSLNTRAAGAVPAKRSGAQHDGAGANAVGPINTQVDDFPKLIEQMSQRGIAKTILASVDFGSFVRKLLQIVQASTCVFSKLDLTEAAVASQGGPAQAKQDQSSLRQDSVPLLVQNSLDLLLPCLLWDPQVLMSQLYKYEHFERLLISGLINSKSEKIRKGIEQNFRTLCYHIEGQQAKNAKNVESKRAQPSDAQKSSLVEDDAKVAHAAPDSSMNEHDLNPKLFLLKILIKNLPKGTVRGKVRNMENQFFDEYFNLLSSLIKICKDKFSSGDGPLEEEQVADRKGDGSRFFCEKAGEFDSARILAFCIDIIKMNHRVLSGLVDKKLTDSKQSAAERLLCGYLQLCQSLLEVIPSLKDKAANECFLVTTITDFIFNTSEERSALQRKQLGRQTRKRAVGLLLTLCEKNESNFALALKILYKFHEQIGKSWQHIDFKEFDSDVGIKQSSGYVGLKNFGCTCYMNSLLQQLYMIPDLRRAVLDVQLQTEGPDAQDQLDENVLHQLQCIFANLQESEKSYFVPKGFVETFKFYGEPINVRVQQDTHEFYNVLCDQIEQLIPKPKKVTENDDQILEKTEQTAEQKVEEKSGQQAHNFLKKTIGGTLCNETRSLEPGYPYVGERDEDFYAVTLDIKNKKTLQEALDLYIKPDVLEGDNKYHCEQYDKKISAERRTYLKDLSNMVVINLKRFEFDYNTMQRLKVNDYCEFPERINFKRWTKEGIDEARKKEESGQGGRTGLGQHDDEADGAHEAEAEEMETFDDPAATYQETVGGTEMDHGIDVDAADIRSDKEMRFQRKDSNFKLDGVAGASGGSRQSGKRRVRSSNKKRGDETEQLLAKQKADEPMNLSAEFDDIDTKQEDASQHAKIQKKGRGTSAREFKVEKEQAIIDEDAYSEDAKSVDSKDSASRRRRPDVGSQGDKSRARGQKKGAEKREERRGSAQVYRESADPAASKKRSTSRESEDKYEYQLVGVLVHSGSADAGHYYSFIKERNRSSQNYGRWFEFNDTTVKEFAIQNLKKECFGGQQQRNNDGEFDNEAGANNQIRIFERCSNAYLIFYERIETKDKAAELAEEEQSVARPAHQQQIFNKIHEENQAFKHLKIFSDNDFIKFMLDYINLCTFQEVLYFPMECSDSFKMAAQRRLVELYVQDWETQRRKARRLRSTQELKGLAVTPAETQLQHDYAEEQRLLRASRRDVDIFGQLDPQQRIENLTALDVGLKTIQLATVLAQDIILQLRDTQAFVQLLQKLNQMYQSHAMACVWFLKWITEQEQVLQRVLLGSHFPEVREVFANLLSTTFSITIKNEEKYLGDVEQQYDLDCDRESLERRELRHTSVQRSAALRLVRLLIDEMMHCARANWRNFAEYFILLKDIAQSHFQVAAFLIQRDMIRNLLQFIMNGKPPFHTGQAGSSFRMGDAVQQPDFSHACVLFAYLVRCCLTDGITTVHHYSPHSVFEEEEKCIRLRDEHLAGFFTSDCQQEILSKTHLCSESQNQALAEVVVHLCWGDIAASLFFLQELIDLVRARKGQVNMLDFHLNLMEQILLLEDSSGLKAQRVEHFFRFGEHNLMPYGGGLAGHAAGPSSGEPGPRQAVDHTLGFFAFLHSQAGFPIYRLKLINFMGGLALRETNGSVLLDTLREHEKSYRDWVVAAMHRIGRDSRMINRAQLNFNLRLTSLVEQTLEQYGQILQGGLDGYVPGVADSFQAMQVDEERSPELPRDDGDEVATGSGAAAVASPTHAAIFKTERPNDAGAMNLEDIRVDVGQTFDSDGEEESIFKLTGQNCAGSPLVATQGPGSFASRPLNDSFSGIPELLGAATTSDKELDSKKFVGVGPPSVVKAHGSGGRVDHSFTEYGDEVGDRDVVARGHGSETATDADDQALRDALGHLTESKPTLEHRTRVSFPRAAGSNPFQAGAANHAREMAPIDLSKVQHQSQPALGDQPQRFEMRDINEDRLGDILPTDCDDELLASGLPEAATGDVGGSAGFRPGGQGDAFAFEVNSAEFATGGADEGNSLEGPTGIIDDITADPELMKQQLEELQRYEKMRSSQASQPQDDND